MAEYKRFISYIYAYDRGIKSKNVGFAKMEVRNGECRININIKGAFAASGKELEVYLFHREQENLLGTCMGSFSVKNGTGEFRSITSADNVGGSGLALDKMNGIVLRHADEEARIYASGWDDHAVIPGKFVVFDRNKEEDSEKISAVLSELAFTEEKEELTAAEVVPVMEAVEEELARLSASIDAAQSELESKFSVPVMQPEPQVPAAEPVKTIPAVQPEIKPEIEPVIQPQIQPEPQMPATETEPVRPEIQPVIQPMIQPQPAPPEIQPVPVTPQVQPEIRAEAHENDDSRPKAKKEVHNSLWDRLENVFPKVVAFEDEPEISCLKIDLKDLEYLPRENWGLANNSFLLHGYYNFRYLILARMGENQYMIGIPGMFHNNERFMAAMFGFDHFKPVKEYKPLTGHFGYWYQWIQM